MSERYPQFFKHPDLMADYHNKDVSKQFFVNNLKDIRLHPPRVRESENNRKR